MKPLQYPGAVILLIFLIAAAYLYHYKSAALNSSEINKIGNHSDSATSLSVDKVSKCSENQISFANKQICIENSDYQMRKLSNLDVRVTGYIGGYTIDIVTKSPAADPLSSMVGILTVYKGTSLKEVFDYWVGFGRTVSEVSQTRINGQDWNQIKVLDEPGMTFNALDLGKGNIVLIQTMSDEYKPQDWFPKIQ